MSGRAYAIRGSREIAIRSAHPEDFPAILETWARARSLTASIPDDQATLAELADRDEDALLVAEDGGAIVGTLIAAWDGWRGNMYRLTVVPERQREGIASALVRAGEERLRAKGARRITALVASEDLAVALWTAAGYVRDEGIARFVRNL